RAGRQSRGQCGHRLFDGQIAHREKELVLALEVCVDRTDGESALADDVLHRRTAEPARAEYAEGGREDALADLLLVLEGDPGHLSPSWTTHKTNGRSRQYRQPRQDHQSQECFSRASW